MKGFNKIIVLIIFLVVSFLGISNVKSAELTTSFSGYYWDRQSDDYHGSGSFRYYYLDGIDSYCLNPIVHEGGPISLGTWEETGLSEDIKEKVLLIAYYGYNYTGHQTLKYRAATQALIWETVTGGNNKVTFFTERFAKGEEFDVTTERNEIERLISLHNIKPNFNGNKFNTLVGETIVLEDINNILYNYDITIDGASYKVNGNKLYITPNKDGKIIVKFNKKEVYSSEYKIFVSDIYQDQIVPGIIDNLSDTIEINADYGKISIKKSDSETTVSSGSATLKGAKYGVYKQDNNELITTIITDINGNAVSDNVLPYGKYYLKEVEASEGYKLDNTKYYFDINNNNNSNVHINVLEDIIKGIVKITKYDSETNSCNALGEGSLKGAKYQIINNNNEVVDIVTIDNNCIGYSKELPYGKYKVKEVEAPLGYKIDDNTYDVNINQDNVEVNLLSKEDIIKGIVKITKYDSETNSCNALGEGSLKGAKYQIINNNNEVVDIVTIDNNCIGYSKELPYGKYKVKEVEAPLGYKIDNNTYDVNINQETILDMILKEEVINNYISILKQYDYIVGNSMFVNAETDITFEIFNSKDEKYGEIITNNNGYASITLPYGTWRFHQKNVIDGYQKINDFNIIVDENSNQEHYYNILNNKLSAYVKLIKKDSITGNVINLSGAKFKILNIDTNEFVTQYVGGKLLDTFETDENGIMITYLKLEAGNYKIIEINAPEGYLLNDDGILFSINDDTNYLYNTYGPYIVIEYMNDPIIGQIEINKVGEKFNIKDGTYYYDETPLSDVKFNIYASEDITSKDGTFVYYKKGDKVDRLVTDENGYATSKNLPLGKYYLVEMQTNSNYVLDKEKYYFELKEVDSITPIVIEKYSNINYLRKGKLEITKKDLDNGNLISNTEFEIYTYNDELIYKGLTNESGKIMIEDLPIGKYYIIETKEAEGYKLDDEKKYFEIKRNNQNIKITIENEIIKSKVKIHKVDENDNALEGVSINIYDDNDILIYNGITNKDGNIEVELSYGKYYYKEISTIDNYIINEENHYFEVNEDNKLIEFKLVNIKKEIEVPNTESYRKSLILPSIYIIIGILFNIYAKKII